MKRALLISVLFASILTFGTSAYANSGYRLWLRYNPVSGKALLKEYRASVKAWIIEGKSPTIMAAKRELKNGLDGLLDSKVPEATDLKQSGILVAGVYENSPLLGKLGLKTKLDKVGDEGFVIVSTKIDGKKTTVITANKDIGVLYGVFYFLRLMQTDRNISKLDVVSFPRVKLRMLDHWDNLDESRVYAGCSIWDWHTLPTYIKQRYIDYARANASIGINGTVLNNVNADPKILTREYLVKVAALADLFRPYGIRVYLSANFDSPMLIDTFKTANPSNPAIQQWWKNKVKEIYSIIPDFGGFLVKANSEGQPGPEGYKATQADGANLLAVALKPYHGIVMWRAFIYTYDPPDRAKQAYDIFKPLDGKFDSNVLVQVKNGPLDFQPREPFSPLFGAMPKTPVMMEVDIGQGALGRDISLAYLAPMWRETLKSDTYAKGEGSTVAKVLDGSLFHYKLTGMAGVSNINQDRDWTGNIFGQANWYAFGRLAWNYNLTSREIADEWIRMTFSNSSSVIKPIMKMMLASREDVVNYMDPLGLNMLTGWDDQHGPWVDTSPHVDWNSPYYHRADSVGLGFNRTRTGSDAVDQYFPPVADEFNSLKTCPVKFLLWFHHVPWTYEIQPNADQPTAEKSGKTLWDDLCDHYYEGVTGVKKMQDTWNSLKGEIDREEFSSVRMLLEMQYDDAVRWRNGCVLYFQTFSKLPIPAGLPKPDHDLQYYEKHNPW